MNAGARGRTLVEFASCKFNFKTANYGEIFLKSSSNRRKPPEEL